MGSLEKKGLEREILRGKGAPREWKAVSPFAEQKGPHSTGDGM